MRFENEMKYLGFKNDFNVMFSKNNVDNPKNEREYFDRPIVYQKEGMVFNPLYKKAYEYNWEGTRKPYNMKNSREKFERFDELTRNQTAGGWNTQQSWNPSKSRQHSTNSPLRAAQHSLGFNSTFSNMSNTFSTKNQMLLPVTNGLSNN